MKDDYKKGMLVMVIRSTSIYGIQHSERQTIIVVMLFLQRSSFIVFYWLIQFYEVGLY